MLVKHFKLLISTALQKRCSHATNVCSIDAAVRMQNLSLTDNFLFPLLSGETLAKTMPVVGTVSRNDVMKVTVIRSLT